ncbi:MAG TPA: PKD domain-containing protein, partial [Bacteroidia bacterium]|nr:PKD domain-containing protein [Bacteroidia bacterium]
TICSGQPAPIGANAQGGTGSYTYSWSPALGPNSSYTVYPPAPTTYTVHAVDANGCTSPSASVTVDMFSLVPGDLTVSGPASVCQGTQVTISAMLNGNTGPVTWNWNNQPWTTGGPFAVQPSSSTTYQVNVTNICGTVVSQSIPITVHPNPVVTLSPQSGSGCDQVRLQFADNDPANAGCTYSWDFGDGYTAAGSSTYHDYTDDGNYLVTVHIISPFGCTGSTTTTASAIVYQSPHAGFSPSANDVSELEPTILFQNQCSANTIGWHWDFGDNDTSNVPSPSHTYADKGSYNVRLIATSVGGCMDTTEMPVAIDPEFTLFIPNAFTPNGDGKNDVFLAYGNEVSAFHMMMFDRWGNMIFESNDINKGWDGRGNGGSDIAQQDVYVYKIDVTDFRGKLHRYTGHVSLLQ